MKTFWFEVRDGEFEGEEFFVEESTYIKAWKKATEIFPTFKLHCIGTVTDYEAEMMGLDTY